MKGCVCFRNKRNPSLCCVWPSLRTETPSQVTPVETSWCGGKVRQNIWGFFSVLCVWTLCVSVFNDALPTLRQQSYQPGDPGSARGQYLCPVHAPKQHAGVWRQRPQAGLVGQQPAADPVCRGELLRKEFNLKLHGVRFFHYIRFVFKALKQSLCPTLWCLCI